MEHGNFEQLKFMPHRSYLGYFDSVLGIDMFWYEKIVIFITYLQRLALITMFDVPWPTFFLDNARWLFVLLLDFTAHHGTTGSTGGGTVVDGCEIGCKVMWSVVVFSCLIAWALLASVDKIPLYYSVNIERVLWGVLQVLFLPFCNVLLRYFMLDAGGELSRPQTSWNTPVAELGAFLLVVLLCTMGGVGYGRMSRLVLFNSRLRHETWVRARELEYLLQFSATYRNERVWMIAHYNLSTWWWPLFRAFTDLAFVILLAAASPQIGMTLTCAILGLTFCFMLLGLFTDFRCDVHRSRSSNALDALSTFALFFYAILAVLQVFEVRNALLVDSTLAQVVLGIHVGAIGLCVLFCVYWFYDGHTFNLRPSAADKRAADKWRRYFSPEALHAQEENQMLLALADSGALDDEDDDEDEENDIAKQSDLNDDAESNKSGGGGGGARPSVGARPSAAAGSGESAAVLSLNSGVPPLSDSGAAAASGGVVSPGDSARFGFGQNAASVGLDGNPLNSHAGGEDAVNHNNNNAHGRGSKSGSTSQRNSRSGSMQQQTTSSGSLGNRHKSNAASNGDFTRDATQSFSPKGIRSGPTNAGAKSMSMSHRSGQSQPKDGGEASGAYEKDSEDEYPLVMGNGMSFEEEDFVKEMRRLDTIKIKQQMQERYKSLRQRRRQAAARGGNNGLVDQQVEDRHRLSAALETSCIGIDSASRHTWPMNSAIVNELLRRNATDHLIDYLRAARKLLDRIAILHNSPMLVPTDEIKQHIARLDKGLVYCRTERITHHANVIHPLQPIYEEVREHLAYELRVFSEKSVTRGHNARKMIEVSRFLRIRMDQREHNLALLSPQMRRILLKMFALRIFIQLVFDRTEALLPKKYDAQARAAKAKAVREQRRKRKQQKREQQQQQQQQGQGGTSGFFDDSEDDDDDSDEDDGTSHTSSAAAGGRGGGGDLRAKLGMFEDPFAADARTLSHGGGFNVVDAFGNGDVHGGAGDTSGGLGEDEQQYNMQLATMLRERRGAENKKDV